MQLEGDLRSKNRAPYCINIFIKSNQFKFFQFVTEAEGWRYSFLENKGVWVCLKHIAHKRLKYWGFDQFVYRKKLCQLCIFFILDPVTPLRWEPMKWLEATLDSLGDFWVKKVHPGVQNNFKTWFLAKTAIFNSKTFPL